MTTSTVNVSKDAQDAILQAIEAVYARTQRKPKYSEIQAIYQTSNSYIKPVLAAWIESNSEQLDQSKAEQAPAAVELDANSVKAITDALSVEVAKAQAIADAKLEDERKALYAIRDDALEELQAQMDIADRHFDESNSLKEQLSAESQKVLDLEALANEHKITIGDLNEEIKHLKADVTRSQLISAEHAERYNKAQSELDKLKVEYNSLQMNSMALQGRYDRLSEDFDTNRANHKSDIKQKDEQIDKLTKQVEKITAESIIFERETAKVNGRNDALIEQVDTLQAELAKSVQADMVEALKQAKAEVKK